MSADFNFDQGGLKRALKQATGDGIRDISRSLQRALDRLGRQYEGRPVSEIKPVLQREWRKVSGGTISDPDLTTYATHIAEGTHIKVETSPFRL